MIIIYCRVYNDILDLYSHHLELLQFFRDIKEDNLNIFMSGIYIHFVTTNISYYISVG